MWFLITKFLLTPTELPHERMSVHRRAVKIPFGWLLSYIKAAQPISNMDAFFIDKYYYRWKFMPVLLIHSVLRFRHSSQSWRHVCQKKTGILKWRWLHRWEFTAYLNRETFCAVFELWPSNFNPIWSLSKSSNCHLQTLHCNQSPAQRMHHRLWRPKMSAGTALVKRQTWKKNSTVGIGRWLGGEKERKKEFKKKNSVRQALLERIDMVW